MKEKEQAELLKKINKATKEIAKIARISLMEEYTGIVKEIFIDVETLSISFTTNNYHASDEMQSFLRRTGYNIKSRKQNPYYG